jgi:heme-degrading monooxygenase HmoA
MGHAGTDAIDSNGEYVIVWRYEVAEANREAFERAYGPAGDWGRLFGEADGYIGTELLTDGAGQYMTIDRWRSEADFQAFQTEKGEDYRALDERFEVLTSAEERIGAFNLVAGQDTVD